LKKSALLDHTCGKKPESKKSSLDPKPKKKKLQKPKMARRGSVYCIANDTMPDIVKIGATVRDPVDRLNEARATTWAPTCLRIVAQASVDDAFATEHALHALLAPRRFEARREFFTLTHEEARALFDIVARVAAGAQHGQHTVTAHHEPVQQATRVAGVSVTAEQQLRSWVESNYTHIPLRAKDTGTKLERLFASYTSAAPPVHQKQLGKILFCKMLQGDISGHRASQKNAASTVSGLYLLRDAGH
jgi:hypothetical protein